MVVIISRTVYLRSVRDDRVNGRSLDGLEKTNGMYGMCIVCIMCCVQIFFSEVGGGGLFTI